MNWKDKFGYGIMVFVIVSAVVFYVTPVRMTFVSGTSMEPTIRDGDAVIIVPTQGERVHIGEIIAFKPEPDRRVIHRIIALENGKIRTMGDNSEKPDSWIEPSQVVGIHFLTIPYGGAVLKYVNSAVGFVLLILVPTLLIIYNEGRKIKRELGGRSRNTQ